MHDTHKNTGIQQLKDSLPAESWSEDPELIAPHLHEWRDRWQGHTPLMLTPHSTAEVVKAVKICSEFGLGIVPQGGNTGLVGGQIPQGEVLLSSKRLNKFRSISARSMTVESGCILQHVLAKAESKNTIFPLSLASQGSATIGGLCSTNAGGVHVVRYGSMRNLVTGLEVVLADGSVFNSLEPVKKDNTGYNMTSTFIGAEGTLGVITAASLQLIPKAKHIETLLLAITDVKKAIAVLHACEDNFGQSLSMIELLPQIALDFVTRHIPRSKNPFAEKHPWYLLIHFEFHHTAGTTTQVENFIANLIQNKLIVDAIRAESLAQTQALLELREHISEAQKPEGGSIKHDICVPLEKIPEFIHKASIAVTSLEPGCRPVPFGHIGDGNIHFNVSQPPGMDKAIYLSNTQRMNRVVHDIVSDMGGSISAEHGIGILKKQELAERANPIKLATMRKLKQALDPQNIMNPRVLFL
ncbi:MAG: FAD-binding oxidoreductase [Gammaproteobacteria bacterium]|nr:FAD-binding oxidoreductase [Gammaproteobacteria bacterium]NNC97212.1 FAD-binding oxidoreductase [Gammaproteobacteria bacterium]NNM14999.1 FAD-binding oxidoreductase [Gammaproteobacteria bacterium]